MTRDADVPDQFLLLWVQARPVGPVTVINQCRQRPDAFSTGIVEPFVDGVNLLQTGEIVNLHQVQVGDFRVVPLAVTKEL